MSFEEKSGWRVVLASPAQKSLDRISPPDQTRIYAAIDEIGMNPFHGDVKFLKGQNRLRRRVGNWRIFFRLERGERTVYIVAVERRTSTTY
jgi:mRNA-degrading endonuclease RelE of RelBE toxin-antitoxin system